MRTLPETIAYLRTMIANESVSLMLIETAELAALCDEAEKVPLLQEKLVKLEDEKQDAIWERMGEDL